MMRRDQILALFLLSTICAMPNYSPSCPITHGLRFYSATLVSPAWALIGESSWTEPDGRMCGEVSLIDPAPGEVVFFIATAFNTIGESPTEHGEAYGDGYDPSSICP